MKTKENILHIHIQNLKIKKKLIVPTNTNCSILHEGACFKNFENANTTLLNTIQMRFITLGCSATYGLMYIKRY